MDDQRTEQEGGELVYANICDPEDEITVEQFRQVIREMGGKTIREGWAIGVDLH